MRDEHEEPQGLPGKDKAAVNEVRPGAKPFATVAGQAAMAPLPDEATESASGGADADRAQAEGG